MKRNLKLAITAAFSVLALAACGSPKKVETFQPPPDLGPKFGFIDKTGKFVIKPEYRRALSFSDGLAAVDVSARWGFIDPSGKFIIERQFEDVIPFAKGYAGVKAFGSNTWHLIDKTGTAVSQPIFEQLGPCGEANKPLEPNTVIYCAYREKGKWGFVSTSGETKVEPKYDQVGPFSEGFAAVAKKSKWGFIDATGKEITDFKFDQASPFQDRVAECRFGNDFVIIDEIGTMSISDPLHSRILFHDNLALSLKKGKYGFINTDGKAVIRRRFTYAEDFCDGLAVVGVANTKRGFIDPTGKFVIPPVFTEAHSFVNGLAVVKIDTRLVGDDGMLSASAIEEALKLDPHAGNPKYLKIEEEPKAGKAEDGEAVKEKDGTKDLDADAPETGKPTKEALKAPEKTDGKTKEKGDDKVSKQAPEEKTNSETSNKTEAKTK